MTPHIIRQDWWLIRSIALYKILALLLVVLVAIAAWNGHSLYQQRLTTQASIKEYEAGRFAKLESDIKKVEAAGTYTGNPFQDPRAASNVAGKYGGRFVLYPFQPLSAWAIGQSDLYPHYYRLTATKKGAMLVNDEIEHPQVQFNGSFDLGFVIIYLLPLLIISFTYNLTASEREGGTLRLLLSEPVSFRRIIATKMGFRFLLFSGLLVLLLLLAALFTAVPINGSFGLFVLTTLAWTAFWFALSFFINSISTRSAGTTAGALVAVWLAFVLLVPGIFSYVVNQSHPVPSRISLITESREAAEEIKKRSSQVLAKYLEDHPEMAKDTAGINPNDFATKFYTSQIELERTLAPLENSFATQLQKQRDWVGRFRYISPAVVMQDALNGIAATDENAYQQFGLEVDRFYKRLQDYYTQRIVRKQAFASADLATIPKPGVLQVGSLYDGSAVRFFLGLVVLLGVMSWMGLKRVMA